MRVSETHQPFWRMLARGHGTHPLTGDVKAVNWLPLGKAVQSLTHPREKLFLAHVGPRVLAASQPRSPAVEKPPKKRSAARGKRRAKTWRPPAAVRPDPLPIWLARPAPLELPPPTVLIPTPAAPGANGAACGSAERDVAPAPETADIALEAVTPSGTAKTSPNSRLAKTLTWLARRTPRSVLLRGGGA